ncbi:unnamed protein product [Hymenolepis diminuta]|uniref:Uncharacterized protein n=1 Tax=Hymenolepis diminuta TaxID=6216 RepID=A0A564YD70_HYMDI|nr:unnamed protein product [Hymenolepis diminuta]
MRRADSADSFGISHGKTSPLKYYEKSKSLHKQGIRAETEKREPANYIQICSEKGAMFPNYCRDHCSSDAAINEEFQCPISDSFKSYKRQGLFKRRIS